MARWKRNHGTEQPTMLAFVDTETYFQEPHMDGVHGKHLLRLGHLHLCRWDGSDEGVVREVDFTSADVFWRELWDFCQPKKVLWLFSHNLTFDLWVLGWPEKLQSGDSTITKSPQQGPPARRKESGDKHIWRGLCSIDRGATIIHTITHGYRVNMIDTLNYYRCPLASLGDDIGLPKLPLPGDTDDESHWRTYCRRDVDIIRRAMTGLMREWKASGLGNWQPTAPSLAYSAYRHRFMTQPIVPHNDPETGRLERAAYYDGRTQPLRYGVCPESVWHLDVSSLYPSVMLGNPYPYQAECDNDGIPLMMNEPVMKDLLCALSSHCVIASVKINTDTPLYPVRHDNRVIYPVGTFNTTLCTPELLLAGSHGHISKCNWMLLYKPSNLWDSWVKYWWERREFHRHGGRAESAEVCKVMLNSLAGKIGQRNRHWMNAAKVPVDEPWHSWVHYDADTAKATRCRSIGFSAQVLIDAGDAPHALVAAAAHVNSYARVRMLELIKKCPRGSVYYVGNDALLCSTAAYESLNCLGEVEPNTLGKLRLCGVYERVVVHGPRDYEADGKTVKAGLPRCATRLADRRWQVDVFEDADSLICRPPDGSVHTTRTIIDGSERDPLLYGDDEDEALPPRMIGGKLMGIGLAALPLTE